MTLTVLIELLRALDACMGVLCKKKHFVVGVWVYSSSAWFNMGIMKRKPYV
jgi:hypothetical protein